MKKRILIIYATYGSGHKAIANYIKKYFSNKNTDLEILTLDILEYSMPLIGKISKRVSEYIMLKHPVVWDIVCKISDVKPNAILTEKAFLTLYKNKSLKKIIKDFNPDLTISTHFLGAPLILQYNKKRLTNSKIITIVTDHAAHELWINSAPYVDCLVVSSKEEMKYLISKRKIPKDKVKAFGIPIFPVTNSDFNRNEMIKNLGFDKSKQTCVFFAGGGNGSTATLPYIKRVLKKRMPLNFVFIAGKNEKSENKIKQYIKKYNIKNCKVYGFATNVPELLQVADFVVTKPGGAQTTECLYYRKPMIMLRSSGGQENSNVKYITKKNYGKMLWTSWTFANYLNKIANNPKTLDKMNKALSKMNNQDAIDKIYKLAMNTLNK